MRGNGFLNEILLETSEIIVEITGAMKLRFHHTFPVIFSSYFRSSPQNSPRFDFEHLFLSQPLQLAATLFKVCISIHLNSIITHWNVSNTHTQFTFSVSFRPPQLSSTIAVNTVICVNPSHQDLWPEGIALLMHVLILGHEIIPCIFFVLPCLKAENKFENYLKEVTAAEIDRGQFSFSFICQLNDFTRIYVQLFAIANQPRPQTDKFIKEIKMVLIDNESKLRFESERKFIKMRVKAMK